MSEYEEGHVHFTVSEFARLCEELGLDYVLPLFIKQLRIYKSIPVDIDAVIDVMQALDRINMPVAYAYQVLVNEALIEAEEAQDEVLITDEQTPDGKQVH